MSDYKGCLIIEVFFHGMTGREGSVLNLVKIVVHVGCSRCPIRGSAVLTEHVGVCT